jgi:hypothetical protein
MSHCFPSFHFTLIQNRLDQIFGATNRSPLEQIKTVYLSFGIYHFFVYIHTASSQFLLFTDVTRGIVGMANINDPEKQTTIIRAVKPLAVTYHVLQKVSTNQCRSVLFPSSWKSHIISEKVMNLSFHVTCRKFTLRTPELEPSTSVI